MTREFSAMDLRKGLAQVPERALPSTGPDAPSPEDLWDAAHGQLDPRRAQQVIDQAIADPVLWEEWRLLQAFTEELALVEQEPAANDDPSEGRRYWGWVAVGGGIAAALVAALSLQTGVQTMPSAVDDGATYRADEAQGLESLLPADASLPRDAFELRWSAGAAGVRYEVQVSTAAPRLLLHKQGLTEARLMVPAEALSSVPSGSQILWRVEEVSDDGRRRSATFVTTVQ